MFIFLSIVTIYLLIGVGVIYFLITEDGEEGAEIEITLGETFFAIFGVFIWPIFAANWLHENAEDIVVFKLKSRKKR